MVSQGRENEAKKISNLLSIMELCLHDPFLLTSQAIQQCQRPGDGGVLKKKGLWYHSSWHIYLDCNLMSELVTLYNHGTWPVVSLKQETKSLLPNFGLRFSTIESHHGFFMARNHPWQLCLGLKSSMPATPSLLESAGRPIDPVIDKLYRLFYSNKFPLKIAPFQSHLAKNNQHLLKHLDTEVNLVGNERNMI